MGGAATFITLLSVDEWRKVQAFEGRGERKSSSTRARPKIHKKVSDSRKKGKSDVDNRDMEEVELKHYRGESWGCQKRELKRLYDQDLFGD